MKTGFALDGPRFGPAAGGAARQLVVLLHGWGADGDDLIGLAPHWARALPHAAFASPHAPFPQDQGFGRQWFSLGDLRADGDMREEIMMARLAAVAPLVDAFLDAELARHALGADKLALVGFSQGTMTALYAGPRRKAPPQAIIGYSGRLIGAAELGGPGAKSEILLVHGEDDEIVPVQSTRAAEKQLRAAGFAVSALYRPGLGHGIDPEGLDAGGAFLRRALGG